MPSRPRTSPETRAAFVSAYRAGDSISVIATRHGINPATVWRHLQAAGEATRRNRKKQVRAADLCASTLLSLYDAGESLASLAQKVGADARTVKSVLVAHGRKIRPEGTLRPTLDPARVFSLYDEGASLPALASTFSVSEHTIRTFIIAERGEFLPSSKRRRAALPLDDLLLRYEAGVSLHALAVECRISREVLSSLFEEYGAFIRPAGGPVLSRRRSFPPEVLAAYRAGKRPSAIAREYKTSTATVERWLTSQGETLSS